MDLEQYIRNRLIYVRKKLAEQSLDALILVDSETLGWENVYYYSGFHGSSAIVCITADKAILLTDSRYLTQAAEQSCLELRPMKPRATQLETVAALIKELGLNRIGFDGDMLSASMYLALTSTDAAWFPFSAEMYEQRRHKDAYEIEMITRAADIAGEAYMATLDMVREGMTEKEFSKLLELNIARRSGEGVWHKSSMIVASGVRSALPHGTATDRKMQLGDQVTVDFGAIYGNYMSDITRNFSLGPVSDPEFLDIYGIVLKAHRDSAAALRPGAKGDRVHEIAASIIREAGYGDYFGHGLGHSFGLEIHESPRLSPSYSGELMPGDLITVEPGIYIPGRGGLRVEDDYLITDDGAVRVTEKLSQDFIHLPL